jgi:hypothetical protein
MPKSTSRVTQFHAIDCRHGVDIGKNTFHLVDLDKRGAIVSQLNVSRPARALARQSPVKNANLG